MEFLDGATLKHLIGNLPDVCVMLEQMKDGQELFRFDPIGDPREHSRFVVLQLEDAACQILGGHQPLATLTLGEQLNSIKDFCLGGRGQHITQAKGLVRPDRWSLSFDGKNLMSQEFCCGFSRNPYHNPRRGLMPHDLGEHIRVEDDPHLDLPALVRAPLIETEEIFSVSWAKEG